jgi:hypothetical protein
MSVALEGILTSRRRMFRFNTCCIWVCFCGRSCNQHLSDGRPSHVGLQMPISRQQVEQFRTDSLVHETDTWDRQQG